MRNPNPTHIIHETTDRFLWHLCTKNRRVRVWCATFGLAFVWQGKTGITFAGYAKNDKTVCVYRAMPVSNWELNTPGCLNN